MKKLIVLFLTTLGSALFSQIPSYIPLNGLVAFYPFDGNANDVSGNNNHAAVNGPTLTSDRHMSPSSAYLFNGTNNFMAVNLTTTLTANWTISGWYKINGGNSFNAYYSFGLGFTPNANGFGFGGTAHTCYPMQYGMYDGGIGPGCQAAQSLHGNITPDYNEWMHVVLVKSSTTYSFYFNGVFDNSASLTPIAVGNFVIGKRSDNILYYKGVMDEIGIWDRELTPAEIEAISSGTTTVSVKEESVNNNIVLYPNPSNGIVNLKVNASLLNSEFNVTDVLGQAVYKDKLTKEEMSIDLPPLSSGVYFFTIQGIPSKKMVIE